MSKEIVKATSVRQLFEMVKLDYTNLTIGASDNINFDFTFPVMPSDYLKFAQQDMLDPNEKGLINALSNSKRSIDCLVEVVLRSLNIDPDNIPSAAIEFCSQVLTEKEQSIKPISLRLFCALGLAPSFLISEVRSLRNKVEHEFQVPSEVDVTRALEVAELLLSNVKAKEIYSCFIDVSDTKRRGDLEDGYITGVRFSQSFNTKSFRLDFRDKRERWIEYQFDTSELQYYFFLRAMFVAEHYEEKLADAIRKMILSLSIKTPERFVKIARVHR